MSEEAANWNNIPPVLFVTGAKTDGVVWDVGMCSVPHALAPEVVYRRSHIAPPLLPPPYWKTEIAGTIRAFSSATTAEADAAAIAILRHINNWFGLGRDPTNPFAPR